MPSGNYTSDEGDQSFKRPRRPPPVVSSTPKDFAACRSIKAETLRPLLDLSEEEFSNKYILIDCRYPYEYAGGHIKYAINFHDYSKCHELFFPDNNEEFEKINKKIPIFYCEFSQVRGPKMAQTLRQLDRKRNEDRYPLIDYEEMYLLERGYNNFYKTFKKQGCCVPDYYTPMNAKRFNHHLKQFTFHRARSQASLKPCTQESRAAVRQQKRRIRLQSTQSCATFSTPSPSPRTSTPSRKKAVAGAAPSMLDQELQKWRDMKRITSLASNSEWDSTIDGSFEHDSCIENLSPIGKLSNEEIHTEDDDVIEALEVSSTNSFKSSPLLHNSYCKPVQLSFSCD